MPLQVLGLRAIEAMVEEEKANGRRLDDTTRERQYLAEKTSTRCSREPFLDVSDSAGELHGYPRET